MMPGARWRPFLLLALTALTAGPSTAAGGSFHFGGSGLGVGMGLGMGLGIRAGRLRSGGAEEAGGGSHHSSNVQWESGSSSGSRESGSDWKPDFSTGANGDGDSKTSSSGLRKGSLGLTSYGSSYSNGGEREKNSEGNFGTNAEYRSSSSHGSSSKGSQDAAGTFDGQSRFTSGGNTHFSRNSGDTEGNFGRDTDGKEGDGSHYRSSGSYSSSGSSKHGGDWGDNSNDDNEDEDSRKHSSGLGMGSHGLTSSFEFSHDRGGNLEDKSGANAGHGVNWEHSSNSKGSRDSTGRNTGFTSGGNTHFSRNSGGTEGSFGRNTDDKKEDGSHYRSSSSVSSSGSSKHGGDWGGNSNDDNDDEDSRKHSSGLGTGSHGLTSSYEFSHKRGGNVEDKSGAIAGHGVNWGHSSDYKGSQNSAGGKTGFTSGGNTHFSRNSGDAEGSFDRNTDDKKEDGSHYRSSGSYSSSGSSKHGSGWGDINTDANEDEDSRKHSSGLGTGSHGLTSSYELSHNRGGGRDQNSGDKSGANARHGVNWEYSSNSKGSQNAADGNTGFTSGGNTHFSRNSGDAEGSFDRNTDDKKEDGSHYRSSGSYSSSGSSKHGGGWGDINTDANKDEDSRKHSSGLGTGSHGLTSSYEFSHNRGGDRDQNSGDKSGANAGHGVNWGYSSNSKGSQNVAGRNAGDDENKGELSDRTSLNYKQSDGEETEINSRRRGFDIGGRHQTTGELSHPFNSRGTKSSFSLGFGSNDEANDGYGSAGKEQGDTTSRESNGQRSKGTSTYHSQSEQHYGSGTRAKPYETSQQSSSSSEFKNKKDEPSGKHEDSPDSYDDDSEDGQKGAQDSGLSWSIRRKTHQPRTEDTSSKFSTDDGDKSADGAGTYKYSRISKHQGTKSSKVSDDDDDDDGSEASRNQHRFPFNIGTKSPLSTIRDIWDRFRNRKNSGREAETGGNDDEYNRDEGAVAPHVHRTKSGESNSRTSFSSRGDAGHGVKDESREYSSGSGWNGGGSRRRPDSSSNEYSTGFSSTHDTDGPSDGPSDYYWNYDEGDTRRPHSSNGNRKESFDLSTSRGEDSRPSGTSGDKKDYRHGTSYSAQLGRGDDDNSRHTTLSGEEMGGIYTLPNGRAQHDATRYTYSGNGQPGTRLDDRDENEHRSKYGFSLSSNTDNAHETGKRSSDDDHLGDNSERRGSSWSHSSSTRKEQSGTNPYGPSFKYPAGSAGLTLGSTQASSKEPSDTHDSERHWAAQTGGRSGNQQNNDNFGPGRSASGTNWRSEYSTQSENAGKKSTEGWTNHDQSSSSGNTKFGSGALNSGVDGRTFGSGESGGQVSWPSERESSRHSRAGRRADYDWGQRSRTPTYSSGQSWQSGWRDGGGRDGGEPDNYGNTYLESNSGTAREGSQTNWGSGGSGSRLGGAGGDWGGSSDGSWQHSRHSHSSSNKGSEAQFPVLNFPQPRPEMIMQALGSLSLPAGIGGSSHQQGSGTDYGHGGSSGGFIPPFLQHFIPRAMQDPQSLMQSFGVPDMQRVMHGLIPSVMQGHQ